MKSRHVVFNRIVGNPVRIPFVELQLSWDFHEWMIGPSVVFDHTGDEILVHSVHFGIGPIHFTSFLNVPALRKS